MFASCPSSGSRGRSDPPTAYDFDKTAPNFDARGLFLRIVMLSSAHVGPGRGSGRRVAGSGCPRVLKAFGVPCDMLLSSAVHFAGVLSRSASHWFSHCHNSGDQSHCILICTAALFNCRSRGRVSRKPSVRLHDHDPCWIAGLIPAFCLHACSSSVARLAHLVAWQCLDHGSLTARAQQ